jgi:hypothetical protein
VLSSSEKIAACRLVATQLTSPGLQNSNDFARYLSVAVAALLRSHGDEDLSVWTVAEESLNMIIKVVFSVDVCVCFDEQRQNTQLSDIFFFGSIKFFVAFLLFSIDI